jgi:hypothetical protein
MSSIFGGSTTSKTDSQAFNGQYEPFVNSVINRASNYQATPYTGKLSADKNSAITDATKYLSTYANNGVMNDFASGKYLDPKSNPYAMDAYNTGVDKLMDAYSKLDSNIIGNYNKGGLMSSSMRLNAQDKNAASTKNSLADYTSTTMNNLYNTNLSNMMTAADKQQTSAKSLLDAGTTNQSVDQSALDKAYTEFVRQQGVSEDNIKNLISLVSAIKNPNASSTTTQKQSGLFGK